MSFEIKQLKELLKDYPKEDVGIYVSYCNNMNTNPKNTWFSHLETVKLAEYFRAVKKDNLDFDGKHITILSTGVSYDYVAYKNKMYQVYPESIIDLQLVYKGDSFNFSKENGKVIYTHKIENPFNNQDENIVGGYCVIKNKRGEFLVNLSKEEFQKHRAVAKTKYIWDAWYPEMCMKTLVKKGCSKHFSDIYQNIETIDNENYDLENIEPIKKPKLSGVEFAKMVDSDDYEAIGVLLSEYDKGELTMYPNQYKELTGQYNMLMDREMGKQEALL